MKKRQLSISMRVIGLTLLPMTALAFILCAYFTFTRVADTRANLNERGHSLSNLIASAAEFGVLSGNVDMLRNLADGPINKGDVAGIIFYDKDHNLIFNSSTLSYRELRFNEESAYSEHGIWFFRQPITTSSLPLKVGPEMSGNDSGEMASPQSHTGVDNERVIGGVFVLISGEETKHRELMILFSGIALTLICLLVTFALSYRFGRRISQPIIGLTRLIERLQRGELDARANVSHTGELHTLAHGINRLAARVQESNLQFEYRVESATRRLTQALRNLERRNQELLSARQRADEANRAKDEFLARMSHELRTPLTSVLGFTHLLAETPLGEDQKQYVQIVTRTSRLLLTIIDDILDFSRLESDAIELESIDFDLEQCLFDLVETHSAVASEKGLELIVALPQDLPVVVKGDPTRLSQIINNLIGNSIKFTDRGEIQLEVTLDRTAVNDPRMTITVRDTGIGIPSDRTAHLFSAFNQADSSIRRRFGGSGLGLAIAHRLVLLMGGNIDIFSEQNLGTEIKINLPLQFGQREYTIQCIENQPPELLVYENCESARSTMMSQLQPFTQRVRQLPSLDYLSTLYAPDTVLLVGTGPNEVNREQLQELIGQLKTLTSMPIIIFSYRHMPADMSCDQVRLMSKPPRPGQLLAALDIMQPVQVKAEVIPTEQILQNRLKVLVAEDNEFNRLLVRRLLERMGAAVTTAADGFEVLAAVQDELPDLILMDVHMPGLDGIEATRRVRQKHPHLPIIALTANVVEREHQVLIEAGINDLILKPINVNELVRVLHQHTQGGDENSPTLPAPVEVLAEEAPDLQQLTTPEQLMEEVRRLVDTIRPALAAGNRSQIRDSVHQLLGLAGLYEMPILEDCTAQLREATHEGSMRDIWYAYHRLQRVTAGDELA